MHDMQSSFVRYNRMIRMRRVFYAISFLLHLGLTYGRL